MRYATISHSCKQAWCGQQAFRSSSFSLFFFYFVESLKKIFSILKILQSVWEDSKRLLRERAYVVLSKPWLCGHQSGTLQQSLAWRTRTGVLLEFLHNAYWCSAEYGKLLTAVILRRGPQQHRHTGLPIVKVPACSELQGWHALPTVYCFAGIWVEYVPSCFAKSFSLLSKTLSGGGKLWPVTANTRVTLDIPAGTKCNAYHGGILVPASNAISYQTSFLQSSP